MSDLNRIIDNGLAVVVFRNDLGSVTSFAVPVDHEDVELAKYDAESDGHLTDDFSVEKSMKRLADKVFKVGDYSQ